MSTKKPNPFSVHIEAITVRGDIDRNEFYRALAVTFDGHRESPFVLRFSAHQYHILQKWGVEQKLIYAMASVLDESLTQIDTEINK